MTQTDTRVFQLIDIKRVYPNPRQPRRNFDQGAMDELATSIMKHGVLQPIEVEEVGDGRFILHHGERRLRAAKMAGNAKIPALIAPAKTDTELLLTAIIENIQREPMNPIEEGMAYAELLKLGYTRSKIANTLGRSHETVTGRLGWLEQPEGIRDLVAAGELPVSYKCLAALNTIADVEARTTLAKSLAGPGASIKAVVDAVVMFSPLTVDTDEKMESAPAKRNRKGKPRPRHRIEGRLSNHTDREAYSLQIALKDGQPIGELDWQTIEDAADHVCRACPFFEFPPEIPCQECALTTFLRKVAKGNGGAK